jgi:hypothetical protein
MPNISLCYHFSPDDKDKELKPLKFSKHYKQTDLFIKIYKIQYALLYKQKHTFNHMFHVFHILKHHFKRLNKMVLMWDFGRPEMDYKTISCLCEIFYLKIIK